MPDWGIVLLPGGPTTGWSKVATGRIEIFVLAVDSGSIFIELFEQVLTERLRESLDQAFSVQIGPVESEFVLQ